MLQWPETENTVLLRTDFSEDAAWVLLSKAAQALSEDGFQANVACVSDRCFDGLTLEHVVALARKGSSSHSFAFIADRITLTDPERPVLVVELSDAPGRNFRVIPSQMWAVENNLSLGNMDFPEFAENVDPDGVFRGFPTS